MEDFFEPELLEEPPRPADELPPDARPVVRLEDPRPEDVPVRPVLFAEPARPEMDFEEDFFDADLEPDFEPEDLDPEDLEPDFEGFERDPELDLEADFELDARELEEPVEDPRRELLREEPEDLALSG